MLKLDKLDSMEIIRVGVSNVNHGSRLRSKNEETVKRLATSFKEVGQLSPIIVRKMPGTEKYNLVAGLHRLYAAKKLKWAFIQGVILAEGSDAELESQEVEIRENLDRGELTLQERAVNVQALEEVLKKKHAKKPGSAPGKAGGGKKAKIPQVEGISSNGKVEAENGRGSSATTQAIAEETGLSPATIERDVNRASNVPRILETEGTSLDSGVELDALAKLPEAVQNDLIDKAIAGEHVSARDVLNPPEPQPPKPTKKDRQYEDACNAVDEFCDAIIAAEIPIPTLITWFELWGITRNAYVKMAVDALREHSESEAAE